MQQESGMNEQGITLEELMDCRQLQMQMELLEEKRMEWKMRAEYRAYRPGSTHSDNYRKSNVERCMAEVERTEEALRELVMKYAATIRRVEQAIHTLPPKQALIMQLRCISGLTWRDVSSKANYEESWCRRQMKKALANLGLDTNPY